MRTTIYSIFGISCIISSSFVKDIAGGASSSRSKHPSYDKANSKRINEKNDIKECRNTTLNDLPNNILHEVFKSVAFSYVRESLARVNKGWKEVAYSKSLHPTEVSLYYLEYLKEKKISYLIEDQQEAAIDIQVLRTLDINVEGDINRCENLNDFAFRQQKLMNNLERLKINFDWTSSNDNTVALITKLLLKSGKINKLVIKWSDNIANKLVVTKDESKNYETFWKQLENSKVNDVKFELKSGYDDYKAKRILHFSRSIAPFLAYLFQNDYVNDFGFLKNLRELTMKVPPNECSYKFVKKTILNSRETLEVLDIDFYYFVHWVKEENLFEDLKNCISLRKLILNFPLIDYKWNENSIHGRLEYPAVDNLINFLFTRNVYFELKTSYTFLRLYNLYIFVTFPEEIIPLKAITFLDDFWNGNYKNDVGFVLKHGGQKLRKLKIVFRHRRSAKTDVVEHYFTLASKLPKLEEFFIAYSRDNSNFEDNYDDLKKLAITGSRSITKITIRVTSVDYLDYLDSCKKAENHYVKEEKEKIIKERLEKHNDYVAKHVLNLSEIRKFQSDVPMFRVESNLVIKYRKGDSHQLTLTRRY